MYFLSSASSVVFTCFMCVALSRMIKRTDHEVGLGICSSPIDIMKDRVTGPATINITEELGDMTVEVRKNQTKRGVKLVLQLWPIKDNERSADDSLIEGPETCIGNSSLCYLRSEIRWGKTNEEGSDHSIMGTYSPLEIQHYFQRYNSSEKIAVSVRCSPDPEETTPSEVTEDTTTQSDVRSKRDVAGGNETNLTDGGSDVSGDGLPRDGTNRSSSTTPSSTTSSSTPSSTSSSTPSSTSSSTPSSTTSSSTPSSTTSSSTTSSSTPSSTTSSSTPSSTTSSSTPSSTTSSSTTSSTTSSNTTSSTTPPTTTFPSLQIVEGPLSDLEYLVNGVSEITLNIISTLPTREVYYHYRGTHPDDCEEEVDWIVFEEVVKVEQSLLTKLRQLLGNGTEIEAHYHQIADHPNVMLIWPASKYIDPKPNTAAGSVLKNFNPAWFLLLVSVLLVFYFLI